MDAIKRAVETSEHSQYRIAKETGVSASALSRLLSGERPTLTVDSIEAITEFLELEVVIRPKQRRARAGRRGVSK